MSRYNFFQRMEREIDFQFKKRDGADPLTWCAIDSFSKGCITETNRKNIDFISVCKGVFVDGCTE